MSDIIRVENGKLIVPDAPVIPFIEGDGIGPEVWSAARYVIDSAVERVYRGEKNIKWLEVFAGEKAFHLTKEWLPKETLDAFEKYLVGIKGPLTTPIGKGIRSINVALRQILDLYVCLRPVRYYGGIETPMRRPDKVDMVIFRENTEDIYTGIEFKAGTEENRMLLEFIREKFPPEYEKIRFGTIEKTNEFQRLAGYKEAEDVEVGLGIKVMSRVGTQRLMISALDYALKHKRKSITIVHKGNIMKYTSGSFREWCYMIAEELYGEKVYTMMQWDRTSESNGRDAADKEMQEELSKGKLLIKDAIADNALQKVLTDPEDFDVIATGNLNGDYLSDAIAAQVGGIGIAPGGNINSIKGNAIFEATHGTAPTFAGMNKVNPSSMILSGKMMLEYLGWQEPADLIEMGIRKAIESKRVTFDFARQIQNSTEVKCSEFAAEIVNQFS
ncbi:MAG: isocitrate dehydrogenase (NADP(+)) [Ignavibacteria bacterium]|jgi:isocitrate dehydrogenase|nr:isocitrate dehydrogenase (NADP(+)) [Ignavibacteria bacterium]